MMRQLASAALLAALLGACAAPPARATAPAAFYFGQSLLCRAQATGATCELWLFPTGRYAVFYDRGPATRPGTLRYEGRQGSYAAQFAPGGIQLCLRPEDETPPRPAAPSLLFHDSGCVVLPAHPIGEVFTLNYGATAYNLVLAQGQ
jgi:hypothetical protein